MILTAENATLALARGKAGTCGLIKTEDGYEFIGFGVRRPVLMLRLQIDGQIFTEATAPFHLIMRRGKPDRPAWGVLCDQEWKTLAVSDDTNRAIDCIALISPLSPSNQATRDGIAIPIALKARFTPTMSAVVVIANDLDFANLILDESKTLMPPPVSIAASADVQKGVSNENRVDRSQNRIHD